MSEYNIECQTEISKELEKKIERGHIRDEAAQGIVCNFKKFFLVIKNPEGEPAGVLSAYTAFSEIYIDDLWVDPIFRKYGYGRALIDELQNCFKNKGYNNINLVTSQFQAPDFYKKCGFELEFVRTNKHNPQLTKYFFIKYFDDKQQMQGISKS